MSVPLRWQEVEPEPSPAPLRRRRVVRRSGSFRALCVLAVCAALCAVTAVGARRLLAANPAGLRLASVTSTGGPLALSYGSAERHLGYVSVVGSVSNHSASAVPSVEAVVELLDANGQPVRMESGLIAFDPLVGGESSPFRVELQDDSRAVSYRVRFKSLLGSRLD